jgi:hypothetical protein
MAKNLGEIMPPTRVDTTDPAFAGGKYQDQSVVGAEDGTPLLASEKNQTLAFFDGIMIEGNVPYNNLTDTPQTSQYVQAVVNIATSKANNQIGINIATTAQAEAGTNDNKIMTPLKTKQAIDENEYILPAATQTVLGGVKIWVTGGTTLNIETI